MNFNVSRSVLLVFVLIAIAALIPVFLTEAETPSAHSTADPDRDAFPNYDIRTDKRSYGKIAEFRSNSLMSASMVADIREAQAKGEEKLRTSVPTLKVEYNSDLRIPEVIAPDVARGRNFLTRGGSGKRSDLLIGFLRHNRELIGLNDQQISDLVVAADYTNPDGNLSYVELDQEINGVPVFRGEVKAGFTRSGEIIRVINNLAPGVGASPVSSDFGEPASAVLAAARNLGQTVSGELVASPNAEKDGSKVMFLTEPSILAEKMYFPLEPGVVVPTWRVMITSGTSTYYVITAADGTVFWRKNLTEDQTQPATYNVYINPASVINVAENPFPLTPGPLNPSLGTQGAAISRTAVTVIGNEPPYSFNQLGWITDGNNTTDGNNAQAGLDRKSPNTGNPANPADLDPDGMATGASRVFDFPFSPGDPNNGSGESPLPDGQGPATCLAQTDTSTPSDFQKAVVTQLFYTVNRYHDELYLLGFTEAARNFQNVNFTGQGVGGDRVSAQAQDCSGTNNANFTTPSDGSRPTMQMYLFTGPTPDYDGSLDADVVIHEHTHGLSNRLHGNASGLSTNMSRGMGEGWSDFYGLSLLSQESDPVTGIYAAGGYATFNISAGFTGNYYYGIRRYPKAILSVTGGVNNKPHNAYTFSYLNSDCNSRLNTTNFAFGRGPVGSTICDQVHNVGEIWSTILWEVRAKFVTRLGWAVGNKKMLQLVTDGMKLAPLAPTMLQERDAIIAAAQASSAAPNAAIDVRDMWVGFASRGLGVNASIQNIGSGANNTAVTDGFLTPNLQQSPALTISDVTGNNNGYPEPGETIRLTIPLTNNAGEAATDTVLQIAGGGSVSYGTIQPASTVTREINYTIPAGASCGGLDTATLNVTSSLGPISFQNPITLGSPNTVLTQNFDGVTAPSIPGGWTVTQVQNGTNFVTTTTNADTAPNSIFALDPTAVGGGSDLTSPSIAINAASGKVIFRNRFDTEGAWDGGLLEISIGGGAFQDILAAGGAFEQNGYNSTLGVNTAGNSPLGGRNAWSGNSNGYLTTIVRLPAAASGQNIQLKWRFGADDNVSGIGPSPGWNVDGISVIGSYTCQAPPSTSAVRADFDGDGKTDPSIFRPSDGGWWILGSTAGVSSVTWGFGTDLLTPADYDGDGKTDVAVYRPGNSPSSSFYILRSNGFVFEARNWGLADDVPVVADYDGDSLADAAVFRPSTGAWYVLGTTSGFVGQIWGQNGDVPVTGDFDGDTKADFTVIRDGYWLTLNSQDQSFTATPWGFTTDKPVPADYDGDGKLDIAIFRPSDGAWWIKQSSDGGIVSQIWGQSGDIPVPGRYDGDNKYDIAVYRGGYWYTRNSSGTDGYYWFGAPTDKPIPAAYIP